MNHDKENTPITGPEAEAPGVPEAGGEISRRGFVGGLGMTAGVLAAGMVPAFATALAGSATASEGETAKGGEKHAAAHFAEINKPMRYPGKPVKYADEPGDEKWAMVIDVNGCVGCRRCVYACVRENNIGRDAGFTYIRVLELEPGQMHLEHAHDNYVEAGKTDKWYMPIQCMHCAQPTCVLGCPVKATWKEPDGIVVVDYDKCISCRNCIITCPYEARHNNWVHPHIPEKDINPKVPFEEKAGVIEKCTFCIHRVRNGMTTACTEACPVGARTFGDLNDPESGVSKILATKRVFRLKEELGNEPMIWYVG